jgi:sporulation protein YlmC with PRC-barrel domain
LGRLLIARLKLRKATRRSATGAARAWRPQCSTEPVKHHPLQRSKMRHAPGTAEAVGCFPLIISLQGENHMLAKFIAAGLVGTALLATAASAQTPTTTTDRANMAPAAASDSSFQGDWRASKVVGLSVYNENNESVGSINDLLTDKNGNIKAVVIGVGGFLGVGEHLVAIPFEKIKFVNEPVAYTGVAGAPNAPGSRPASSSTTGAATTNAAPASKPNPWYPDHAVFNATKDELKAMPEFKYSS